MQRAYGIAAEGGQLVFTSGLASTTQVEQSFPGATVTVNVHGGGLASIFSDNSITPLANPFTADSTGAWGFYAANGHYDVSLSGAGITTPIILSDILLDDPGSGGGTVNSVFGRSGTVVAQAGDYSVDEVTGAAPSASPAFTGLPTAPTPPTGNSTTLLATTAFVQAALPAVAVTSVFGRTGAVLAQSGDYSVSQVTGAAPLASPALTGTPTAPTPSFGDSTTKLATTAFVAAALPSAGVTSFNGRGGAVTPANGDYTVSQVTGAAPLASPALTGTPSAPTATFGDSSTLLATTQFVNSQGFGLGTVGSVSLSGGGALFTAVITNPTTAPAIAITSVLTNISTQTGTYLATATDGTILGNGTFTITLPVTGIAVGQTYRIKFIAASGTLTISSAANIDGSTSFTITTQYIVVTVQWDGTQWWKVGN